MKDRFNEYWVKRNSADTSKKRRSWEEKMVGVIQHYVAENYSDLDKTGKIIAALKRDFDSDLPTRVVAEAMECDIELVRRYRYTRDRGVIDTQVGRRESIPKSVRDEVRERDGDECAKCSWEYDLSLHHIVPKSHGGSDHLSNLAFLCPDCHLEAHAGDFSERRIAYDDREDFWERFVQE